MSVFSFFYKLIKAYFRYCITIMTLPWLIFKELKIIFRGKITGKTQCPNCKKWTNKNEPIKQNHLGKKIIQEWKTDVHYLSKGYKIPKSSDRIKHKYKVDKEVDYYSNTYKCSKCNQLFKLEEY
jgi:hypothetical protein